MNLDTMQFDLITEFTFNGQSRTIAKFPSFRKSGQFRDACLPILVSHIRPLESIVAALINQWASPINWGFIDQIIISERDIDEAIFPAFCVIVTNYFGENSFTLQQIDAMMPDHATAYAVIRSQMEVEGLTDYYLRRKVTFIQDVAKFFGVVINSTVLSEKAEELIRSKTTKRDVDPEIRINQEIRTSQDLKK